MHEPIQRKRTHAVAVPPPAPIDVAASPPTLALAPTPTQQNLHPEAQPTTEATTEQPDGQQLAHAAPSGHQFASLAIHAPPSPPLPPSANAFHTLPVRSVEAPVNTAPVAQLVGLQRAVPVAPADAPASDPLTRPLTPNQTGMPNQLKDGIEHLSGYLMDDVRVHRNSEKPAQLQAFAYAQGTDIHLAPGQEQHLPHEAWHVVQQKQGRVSPTIQLKGEQINDDTGLEHEADVMGRQADQVVWAAPSISKTRFEQENSDHRAVVQRQQISEGNSDPMSNNGGPDLGQAEKFLQQAITVVETALVTQLEAPSSKASANATTAPTANAISTPDESMSRLDGDSSIASAAQNDLADTSPLGSEQVEHLQTALLQLQALQGSGRIEEILAACRPILQAIGAEQPAVNPTAPEGEPIQRMATLVAAAPLLGAGPPGWALYAGVALVTLAVAGVTVYEMSRSRERTVPRADSQVEPRVLPRTDDPPSHMGNIHVQGDDISDNNLPNFAWSQATPMTKSEALAGLSMLQEALSSRQMSFRDIAFTRAAAFIGNTMHTAPPPLFRTFQNPNVINDNRLRTRRVDIEIIRGAAFI